MSKTLVIVESPSKAQTIARMLGPGYEVRASYGHIRDLPESAAQIPEQFKKQKWARLGVNVDSNFEPIYVVSADKERHVATLRKAAKEATTIVLATDEDREGESISWHILEILKPPKKTKIERVVFHELTPEAVKQGFKQPRSLDEQLVRAQEARRILDRLFGYTLSPLLWKKVAPKLSAGRVQSVAVRLVVQRERERRDFILANYAGYLARFSEQGVAFEARLERVAQMDVLQGGDFEPNGLPGASAKRRIWLHTATQGYPARLDGDLIDRAIDPTGTDAKKVARERIEPLADALGSASPWTVGKVEKKQGVEKPPVPFMTSTLQQEANRKLGYSSRLTMQIAQQLYEGIDLAGERIGLITYMRTDSATLSDQAVKQARNLITAKYGKDYLPAKPPVHKSKVKNAQEAHEAIRPTDLGREPATIAAYLSPEQRALYDLIWKRTVASQMKEAQVERTRAEIAVEAGGRDCLFVATGKVILFPGFLRVYVEGSDDPEADLAGREKLLPTLVEGQTLVPTSGSITTHETQPPARYTDASLVERMEREGIGRPSTYASILGTIQERGYVFRKGKQMVPTFTAFAVTELLENHFADLVDLAFTAKMEDDLDEIAEGKADAVAELREFYFGREESPGLVKQVASKEQEIPFPALPWATDPEGRTIVVRIGRGGAFLQRASGDEKANASIPDDLPPADLTPELALELLERKGAGPEALAVDPDSGRCVLLKSGRFGDYLELRQTEDEQKSGDKPRRVGLPPGTKPKDLSEEDIKLLLRFPRNLGLHPETGAPVEVKLGRYGTWTESGDKKSTIEDWRHAATLSLDQAVAALAAPAAPRRGQARASGPTVLRDMGEGLRVLRGRFGAYVTDGTTNATLPRGTEPENLDAAEARRLLAERAAAGPKAKPKRRAPVHRKK